MAQWVLRLTLWRPKAKIMAMAIIIQYNTVNQEYMEKT